MVSEHGNLLKVGSDNNQLLLYSFRVQMIENSLVIEIQFELKIEEVASEFLFTPPRSWRVVFDTKVEMYSFQF